jgi:hypothetical protein
VPTEPGWCCIAEAGIILFGTRPLFLEIRGRPHCIALYTHAQWELGRDGDDLRKASLKLRQEVFSVGRITLSTRLKLSTKNRDLTAVILIPHIIFRRKSYRSFASFQVAAQWPHTVIGKPVSDDYLHVKAEGIHALCNFIDMARLREICAKGIVTVNILKIPAGT